MNAADEFRDPDPANMTIGIRGTEFDTVVAADASSAIAADAGAVEISTQTAMVTVGQGQFTRVDADETKSCAN